MPLEGLTEEDFDAIAGHRHQVAAELDTSTEQESCGIEIGEVFSTRAANLPHPVGDVVSESSSASILDYEDDPLAPVDEDLEDYEIGNEPDDEFDENYEPDSADLLQDQEDQEEEEKEEDHMDERTVLSGSQASRSHHHRNLKQEDGDTNDLVQEQRLTKVTKSSPRRKGYQQRKSSKPVASNTPVDVTINQSITAGAHGEQSPVKIPIIANALKQSSGMINLTKDVVITYKSKAAVSPFLFNIYLFFE